MGWIIAGVLVLLLLVSKGIFRFIIALAASLYAAKGLGYNTLPFIKPINEKVQSRIEGKGSRLQLAMQ